LSEIGRIVADEWERTPHVRPYVALDAWVIMPDHLHGIVRIVPDGRAHSSVHCPDGVDPQQDLRASGYSGPDRLHSGSLGAMIGQFKGASTKRIRAAGHRGFAWQTRFYDRIIRNQAALDIVRRYIANNPIYWLHNRCKLERS
jgi:REP element-mobilizing transposase RayT